MRLTLLIVALLAAIATSGAAHATAQIHVDLSTQRMHVTSSQGSYSWPVSTARAGYSTPRGSFAPTGLQRMHYSRKYHNSPMPHSIFFRGGYAIHGSYATGALGRPASHGCVRLSPSNAALLYQIVQNEGGSIQITGARPSTGQRFAKAAPHRAVAHYAAKTSTSHRVVNRQSHATHALAYAPTRPQNQNDSVRAWQADPFSDFPF
ncbi:MAG: L,D-transpeptidase [Methylocystis sp.]|mgnify:FL=1